MFGDNKTDTTFIETANSIFVLKLLFGCLANKLRTVAHNRSKNKKKKKHNNNNSVYEWGRIRGRGKDKNDFISLS